MTDPASVKYDLSLPQVRTRLLSHCRLRENEVWKDPRGRHVIGCGDAADSSFVSTILKSRSPALAVHDPPYNLAVSTRRPVREFVEWCYKWVHLTQAVLADQAYLYVWLGADQRDHFQPLPQFMEMMRETGFTSRSFVTMRNQRGYGTRSNWMAVRQELLCYTKGSPDFCVQYTDIPKILRGYHKEVGGVVTENLERGKSDCIRPGNVWVDVQQVFYRMEENVNGCPAQKPLKAIERIILASSSEDDTVIDFFSHSGTTLLACERLGRRCVTFDIDPIFAEITIRRLERFRDTGKTGWQMGHPFEGELDAAAESDRRRSRALGA